MTLFKFNISIILAFTLCMGILQSCKDESPFSEQEGEGLVRLNVSVSSNLTRADVQTPGNDAELKQNCRIYISNSKGVLHKWVGVDNMPESVYLKYGEYVAEAMAGDSVTASFDKKYFKGAQPFSVSADNVSTQVNVACKLANVVASIDQTTVDSKYVKDLVVTVKNSRGELVFNNQNYMDKGYFMMPKGDRSLSYTVKGKNTNNEEFTKSGTIDGVQAAHDYRFKFQFNPGESTTGGAFFDITIEDVPLIEGEVVFKGKPAFQWSGTGLAIDDQIQGEKGGFVGQHLLVGTFGDLASLVLSSDNASILGGNSSVDLKMTPSALDAYGITLTDLGSKTIDGEVTHRYSIDFSAEWLNGLADSETEYVVHVSATDNQTKPKTATMDVRIANNPKAFTYKSPVVIDMKVFESDQTLVRSKSATIPVTVAEGGSDYRLEYQKTGDSDWQSVPIVTTRANERINIKLSNLAPGATYKTRVSYMINGERKVGEEAEFTTGTIFTIPNASFEEWGTYGNKIIVPSNSNDKITSFWGTGNEGSATVSETLTDKSDKVKYTGNYSACLESKYLGVALAAGNLFTGYFDGIEDVSNGVLQVGRSYDGSLPSKLRVYANYRPGSDVKMKKGNEEFVEIIKGGTDQGQIYVALTTKVLTIRTSSKNRILFKDYQNEVLAYGEVTWKEAFGPDGQLQLVEVPLEYNAKAKTTKPTHLVIVCSASKFGDYFCGSGSSVMYLDDFELVYE